MEPKKPETKEEFEAEMAAMAAPLTLEIPNVSTQETGDLLGSEALDRIGDLKTLEDTAVEMQQRAGEEETQATAMDQSIVEATAALEAAEREAILNPGADHSAAVGAAQGRLGDLQADQDKHRRSAEVLGKESARFDVGIRDVRADARELVHADLNRHASELIAKVTKKVTSIEPLVKEAIVAIRTIGSLSRAPDQLSFTENDLVTALERLFEISGHPKPSPTAELEPSLLAARAVGGYLAADSGRIPLAWVEQFCDLSSRVERRQAADRAAKIAARKTRGTAKANHAPESNEIPSSERTDLPSAGTKHGPWLS